MATRSTRPVAFRTFALALAASLLSTVAVHADTVNLATLSADYTAQDGTTLTNTLSGNYKITIADGATVTLAKANILGTNSTSCQWAGLTCEGDATIILSGANTIRGFHSSYPAIYVPANKKLTICGNGSLTASGNGNSAGIGGGLRLACGDIVVEDGTINATGGWGAGIGAGYGASCGEIHIMGGTVTATGGNGSAGIGSGYNPDGSPTGSCGDILITGGTVTAIGADHGAGIGAGNKMSCGAIRLEGGLIHATGGAYAAGIGGSWMGACGDITITFGIDRINATMGEFAEAPIGKGYGVPCGTITIADGLNDMTRGPTRMMTSWDGYLGAMTHDAAALDGMTLFGTLTGNYKVSIADDATVTLEGVNIIGVNNENYRWAGLTCEGDATIILAGANNLKGFYRRFPGIHVPQGKTLTIRGAGSLIATGSNDGSGIGGGGNIIIESGTITATGRSKHAGISGDDSAQIVIKGGTIIAVGGENGAGIGASDSSPCGNISITGGTVSATGGAWAAGIGGSLSYSCGDINIGEGITRITATKGNFASTIGAGGTTSGCGTISIAENLEQIESEDGSTLTIQAHNIYTITWLDDAGTLIDTTEVAQGVVPTHADSLPTRWAEAPYRYVFTGWTPEPVAATSDATYTATFTYMADLSLLTDDWSPADGDILLPGETPYKIILPAGATVTLDGVALAADGSAPSSPTFADGGAGFLAGFVPSIDGNWTLEAYGDLVTGTAEGVTPDMLQVYAADTVEGLSTATPLTTGVTLKSTQNAVKATLDVTPPSSSETQFFRVHFTTE